MNYLTLPTDLDLGTRLAYKEELELGICGTDDNGYHEDLVTCSSSSLPRMLEGILFARLFEGPDQNSG